MMKRQECTGSFRPQACGPKKETANPPIRFYVNTVIAHQLTKEHKKRQQPQPKTTGMAPLVHESNFDFVTNCNEIDNINTCNPDHVIDDDNINCPTTPKSSGPFSSFQQRSRHTSNNTKQHKKKKKTVKFSKFSLQYAVPSLVEYTDHELQSMHMTDEDYERNEMTIRYMVQRNSGSNSTAVDSHDETYYFRGLECHLVQFNIERRRIITLCVSTVLNEQARVRLSHEQQQQQQDDVVAGTTRTLNCKATTTDPRWIQQVYCHLTSHSSMRAYQIGCWDAQQSL
jgi:hypothetical protein